MRRLMMIVAVAVAIPSGFAAAAQDQKVLMVVRGDGDSRDLELMLNEEVGVMKQMLEQAGFEVVVATTSGRTLAAKTATLEPDLKLTDVKVADYAGVIMPCMAGESEPAPDPVSLAIVRETLAAGKPVAAQLGGIRTLGQAGVLSGRKYAFVSEEAAQNYRPFDGAIYGGTGIVQDANIITSGICPYAAREGGVEDGTSEVTRALIAELGREK